ncbi:hypothetical protein DPMN_052124 [Dreissena polymorpha]|uniref:Uncharacterized protein n=1 Tax=Dreissena polymorpha TaxID=45954 RepID=A0A9D4HPJ4_DREPO|nr:hypothetical protein DPMN_052124 [Dreissena polymorpha]
MIIGVSVADATGCVPITHVTNDVQFYHIMGGVSVPRALCGTRVDKVACGIPIHTLRVAFSDSYDGRVTSFLLGDRRSDITRDR